MPQQPVTSGRSAHKRSATAQRMNHFRTHHTTPSHSRGAAVTTPATARWRDPESARAALADFLL